MSDSLIGKTGRVTARVRSDVCGEVMVKLRGGTATYFAYAADAGADLPQGAQVVIVDESPGRTVYVATH